MTEDGTNYTFDTQYAPDEDVLETSEGRITLIPGPTRELLNKKQRVDYCSHRQDLVKWIFHLGKDPETASGYSFDVVKRRAHDIDVFYRYVWEHHSDGYSRAITHDHANEYAKELAYSDYSPSYKSNVQKSLKTLFRWRDDTEEWNPEFSFGGSSCTAPRDYLTWKERTRLQEVALQYDSIPAYAALSPEERDRWKHYLAQYFDKPLSQVSPDDYEKADGFKYASIICVSLDTGLRPVEVGRGKTEWIDLDNSVLRISKSESAKNREKWTVSLRHSTAELLRHWLRERELYDKYEGIDALWLTRHGNPYGSSALKYILEKLAEIADIDTEDRSLTWYSLRYSVGTYMAREEGLAAAQSQLRHKSIRTTFKYDQAPIEDRRDALDNME